METIRLGGFAITVMPAPSFISRLDAFAAVFLGSATVREGQFYILGALVGVLILAVGNGLRIFGAPTSSQPIFKGAVLVLAVGPSTLARRHAASS